MDPQPFVEDLSFLEKPKKKEDTQIPIPSTKFLQTMYQNLSEKVEKKSNLGRPFEHEKAYEAYCKWYRLPTQLKKPKTAHKFEDKWGLPRRYTEIFHQRDDFKQKAAEYFFEWMMSLWPDVVYSMYKEAVRGSAPQAKAFAEIILKKMDVETPKMTISPMMLIGVPQEKIDKLFIPKEYESVKEIKSITETK